MIFCLVVLKLKLYLHSQFIATGALAQLVEQRTENPCVPGSIPGGTTTKNPIHLNRVFWFKELNQRVIIHYKKVVY